MTVFEVHSCDHCGQPLEPEPGAIPCKVRELDLRADGRVVLRLEAECPKCGGSIWVEWFQPFC